MSEDDGDHQIENRRSCSDNDPREPSFVSMLDPYFRSPKPYTIIEEVLAVENGTTPKEDHTTEDP
jgi:hypothetical protein